MKLNLIGNLVISGLAFTLVMGEAEAKKSKRRGFNFGTSFSMSTGNESGFPTDESPTRTKINESSSSVNPHVGYVVGNHLNLGLSLSFNDSSRHEIETNEDEGSVVNRDRSNSLRSLSFFGRFLFGSFMFLEAGVGAYEQRTSVTNQYTSNQAGGSFSGKREQYNLRGIGTGYHFAGGLEIPIDDGFFFSAAYKTQTYNLRVFKGAADLGEKLGLSQKKEISFGIAHFLR